MRKIFDLIRDEYLEKFSFIVLIFWIISPVIEYILQNSITNYYTYYFSFSIYLVGISGILAYFVYLVKLKRKNKLNLKNFIPEILIILLLILSIISTILSKDFHMSLWGESYRKEGLIVYIMYIGILLLTSIIKDSKYIKYVFKSIILVAFTITFLPLFNDKFTFYNFTNVFHNVNHYGYYLMINVMLAALMFIDNKSLIKKSLYLLVYIFFLYVLIRNNTFGSYLAVGISLFGLLLYAISKKYEKINVILVIIVFLLTSFSVSYFDIKIGEKIHFEDTSGLISRNFKAFFGDASSIMIENNDDTNKAGSGRWLLWKEAFNYTLDHPIIGGGMESLNSYYRVVAMKNNTKYIDRPHNMILQVSSFIGIPGALIYFSLIIYIAVLSLKIMKQNTIHIMIYFTAMCYFISSMFGNSMYYTSPYFMILLGSLIGFIRRKELD